MIIHMYMYMYIHDHTSVLGEGIVFQAIDDTGGHGQVKSVG